MPTPAGLLTGFLLFLLMGPRVITGVGVVAHDLHIPVPHGPIKTVDMTVHR